MARRPEEIYRQLSDLGRFYGTTFYVDPFDFQKELAQLEANYPDSWVFYNPRKPNYARWGLSLTSLDGGVSGRPDLDSLREYNLHNKVPVDEMSFRTSTPYWDHFKSISEPLKDFTPFLGRSHILKLEECGGFPPHRDLGESFRLIAFLKGESSATNLILEDKKLNFDLGHVYFMDTKLVHSLCNFMNPYCLLLVLNIELNEKTLELVRSHLQAS